MAKNKIRYTISRTKIIEYIWLELSSSEVQVIMVSIRPFFFKHQQISTEYKFRYG